MPKNNRPAFMCVAVVVISGLAWAGQAAFEYPFALLDAYDADGRCWNGMDRHGHFPWPVVPEQWLVGPPPSELSAVTLLEDDWVDVAFSGVIADGDGNDILIEESGKVAEEALVFLTDGVDREYLLGVAVADNDGSQALSRIGLDVSGISLPFSPRVLRLVAIDKGGGSPGFDLANVRARLSHDCGTSACCPEPLDGATDVDLDTRLRWTPSDPTEERVVYLAPVEAAVRRRDPAARYPVRPEDANGFKPPNLELGRTYYWRVGDVGDVWAFTVSDRIIVDDFESYDLMEDYLYETWPVRSWAWTSLEASLFHGCHQSMLFEYHYDEVYYAETCRAFDPPQDWTRAGVRVLQLMLRGRPHNAIGAQLYVTLGDGTGEQVIVYDGDMTVLTKAQWHPWRIALADVNGIDLTHVASMTIGLCPLSPQQGERGSGTIHIDDITLHGSLCPEDERPVADVTADCRVDCHDLDRMSRDWLDGHGAVLPVTAPNEPNVWYRFNGNTDDSMGRAHGQATGRPTYEQGVDGQAIHFLSKGDGVVVPRTAAAFSGIRDAITIAFWQSGDDSPHLNDTVCCSNYVYGESNPTLAINLGLWHGPGHYRWDCGWPWSFENRLAGRHQRKLEWTGRWNHWAFTKDIRVGPEGAKGTMRIYLNGRLHDSRTGADSPIANVTSFEIGSGWYGHYDGLIDDFQIYDYALSAEEVAYLATNATGLIRGPIAADADFNADRRVDLRDFAILADEWLQDGRWP